MPLLVHERPIMRRFHRPRSVFSEDIERVPRNQASTITLAFTERGSSEVIQALNANMLYSQCGNVAEQFSAIAPV